MVEAARARGIDAFVADAEALGLEQQARSASSTRSSPTPPCTGCSIPTRSRPAFSRMLRPGGRFVGEMGGAGNIAILRPALRESSAERGYPMPARGPAMVSRASRSSPGSTALAGFTGIEAAAHRAADAAARRHPGLGEDLPRRPVRRRDGAANGSARGRRGHRGARSRRRCGSPTGAICADYVRLRFSMRKPG